MRANGSLRGVFKVALGVVMAFAVLPVAAAPVSAERARKAAGRWLSNRPAAQMNARLHRAVKGVRTVQADGEDVFHVVSLEGGGFVVTAADDRIEPVIAFAEAGTLVEDARNPLWVMLNLDMPRRLRQHKKGAVKARDPAKMRGRGRRRGWKSPTEEWGDLLASPTPSAAIAASAPSVARLADIRVDALVQSTWDQGAVGSKYCYNYYTPEHCVCGCVATAAAQLMRYHRYPAASVAQKSYPCSVNGVEQAFTTKGGAYPWDLMDLKPASSISDASCEAIGRLCYDAGVAARMAWTRNESGSFGHCMAEGLVDVFKYANARCEMDQRDGGIGTEKLENAVYANLDAKCPVLIGILDMGRGAGHDVVADGYGQYDGSIYTHLNLGWSGSCNAWYALPSVSANTYDFSIVGDIVYNVFTNQTGELITGRVLDADGAPLAGATVEAAYKTYMPGSYSRTTVTVTALTDENGVYALHVPSSTTCSLTASAEWYSTATATVSTGRSVTTTFDMSAGTYDPTSGAVGNSWGNEFTLTAMPRPKKYRHTHATWSKGGTSYEVRYGELEVGP